MTHAVCNETELLQLFCNRIVKEGDEVILGNPITIKQPIVLDVDITLKTCGNALITNGNLIFQASISMR